MPSKSLQATGTDALQKAPRPLQRVLHGLDVQFRGETGPTQDAASTENGAAPEARNTTNANNFSTIPFTSGNSIAGVIPGSSNVSVMNEPEFNKNANQIAPHEGMHVWQNNLPPALQAKIPQDNPSDPYNFGGLNALQAKRKQGYTMLSFPREQQAAMVQYRQAQGGDKAPPMVRQAIDPYLGDMNSIPLSQIDMTDPNAKTINTHPRAPLPPIMNYATDTYQKGQPAPGDDPYAAYANKPATEDPYASYANQPSAPEQPEDDRNAFQKRVDSATSTPSTSGPRWLDTFGRAAAGSLLSPLAHPIDTAKGFLKSVEPDEGGAGVAESLAGPAGPMAVNTLRGLGADYKQNGLPHMLGSIAGMAAGAELGDTPFNDAAGNVLKSGGGKMIEGTVGLRQADVARGARPGRAYLEGGGGPALTMRGIARQSGDIADRTGSELSNKYNAATDAGVTIPNDRITRALIDPIERAESIKAGPGGTGGTSAFQEYRDSLSPLLGKPSATPSEVFDAKRNIAANTRWNDPTQFDLNKVRQMNVGGLGGALSDVVPGTSRLNKIYQGTTNLTKRAEMRADTGQSPLSEIGRRSLEGIAGATIGHATGNPAAMLLPLALDSVPVRTAVGSGLFAGGNALPGLVPTLAPLAGASVTARPKQRPGANSSE